MERKETPPAWGSYTVTASFPASAGWLFQNELLPVGVWWRAGRASRAGRWPTVMRTRQEDRQTTLEREVSFSGTGLHTGEEVQISCQPAAADRGIEFVRVDLPHRPLYRAQVESVSTASRRTGLRPSGHPGPPLHTVEHLLAAAGGLGLDNLRVELDGGEVPILDGSAREFVEGFLAAGIRPLDRPRQVRILEDAVWVRGEGRFIVALPHQGFRISCTLSYDQPAIGTNFAEYELDPELFRRELAPARTFGLRSEVEDLRGRGLIRGGGLENAVVVDGDRTLNELRFPDEFVRHKALDIIGDLSLLGPVRLHIIAACSGHELNIALIREIRRVMSHRAGDGSPVKGRRG